VEVNTIPKKKKFLPGAMVFLGLVLYFNIRFSHNMTLVDWAVVLLGVAIFVFAFIRDNQNND